MDISALNREQQNLTIASPVQSPEKLAEHRELIQAVRAVNKAELVGQDNELLFQVDRQTKRMVMRIVNRKTNEVITQVPAEYVLRLAEELRNSQK